jgi:hypothetical protein
VLTYQSHKKQACSVKNRTEFTTGQMLGIQARNGKGPSGVEKDCIESQGPQQTVVLEEEEEEEERRGRWKRKRRGKRRGRKRRRGESYPCAICDKLQKKTRSSENETAAAEKQKS